MKILSHRGFWNAAAEKNTAIAFERSFLNGFGTETDIRDYKGELVIAHDIADGTNISLKTFFELYKRFNDSLFLALNIKASGLQKKLRILLEQYRIKNYFVFDMSVPDALQYLKLDIVSFTRESEYEINPSCYERAAGVWLDEFHSPWVDKKTIKNHLKYMKTICIASSDLHGREYLEDWKRFKHIESDLNIDNLMLCTDHPQKARSFFHEI